MPSEHAPELAVVRNPDVPHPLTIGRSNEHELAQASIVSEPGDEAGVRVIPGAIVDEAPLLTRPNPLAAAGAGRCVAVLQVEQRTGPSGQLADGET